MVLVFGGLLLLLGCDFRVLLRVAVQWMRFVFDSDVCGYFDCW